MCLFVCLFVRAIGVARPRGSRGRAGGDGLISRTQHLQTHSAFKHAAPSSSQRFLGPSTSKRRAAPSSTHCRRAQRFEACGAFRHAGPTSTRHLRGPGALKHAGLEARTASKHSVLPWLPVVYAFINRNDSPASFNLSTRFLRYAVSVQDLYNK